MTKGYEELAGIILDPDDRCEVPLSFWDYAVRDMGVEYLPEIELEEET